ncbi:MAG: DUF222 domain-containing protein, partial [Deltaproteobacteria bacterium]|nr:DUF222 domain-containing protein [Deltaproteobacteria bacterium]
MLEVGTRRSELSALGNENLLLELSKLAREDGRILVEILLHLSEVERRRLHVDRGYRSLFAYCTGKLGWSESEAGRRIAVARAMTQFPAIGELLLSGKVHLSGVAHVAPLLTGENHASLLERISRASRREIETIAAELRPARRTRDGLRALGRLGTEGAPATASPEKNRAQAASRPSSGLQAGRTESEGEAKPKPSAVRTATASGPRAEAAESEDQGRLWPRNATGEFTPTGGSDSSTGTQLGEA